MSIVASVIGTAKVVKSLEDALAKRVSLVDDAIQAAGLECQALAMQNAPVDTGLLRSSITYTRGNLSCTVGTNVEYAIYQEFGTIRMRAHPFLFPAFEVARIHLMERVKSL